MNEIEGKKGFSKRLANIFLNPTERRPRFLWRMVGAALIFVIVTTLIVAVFALFGGTPNRNVGQIQGIVAIIIAIVLALRFLDRRKFSETGVYFKKDWWIDFGFGLTLGALLMLAIFFVEYASGWVTVQKTFYTPQPEQSFYIAILFPFFSFVLVGISEELAFRGYFLPNLAEGVKSSLISSRGALIFSWVFTSAIFGIAHLGNPNATVVSTVNITMAGIFLGFAFVYTRSLAIPIGLHITWNFFQGHVFGFPVSGTNEFPARFISIKQAGPEIWTGGAFGPEGGLIGLFGFLVGLLLMALWLRFRYGKLSLQTVIAETPPYLIRIEEKEIPDLPSQINSEDRNQTDNI
jgi:membrane protease YdiL (CAAX protease family)